MINKEKGVRVRADMPTLPKSQTESWDERARIRCITLIFQQSVVTEKEVGAYWAVLHKS